MTGKNSQNNPTVAEVEERFEIRRRRELLCDLRLWDATVDSLNADLRDERMKAGLSVYANMATIMRSPRLLALLAGMCTLSRWRNETLAELAPLI